MKEDPQSKSHAMTLTLAVVGMLVLYMLSCAPVECWSFNHADIGRGTITSFYAPVYWLREHTPLRGPLWLYYQWWAAQLGLDPFGAPHVPSA